MSDSRGLRGKVAASDKAIIVQTMPKRGRGDLGPPMETRSAKARRCGDIIQRVRVQVCKPNPTSTPTDPEPVLDVITMEPIAPGMEVRLGADCVVSACTLAQAALQDPHGPRNPFTREPLSEDLIAQADAAIAASKWEPTLSGADRAYARAVTGSREDTLPTTLREASAWARQRLEHQHRGVVVCQRIGLLLARSFERLQPTCYISSPPDALLRIARVLRMGFHCGTLVRRLISMPLVTMLRSADQAERMRHTIYARSSNVAMSCLRMAMARGATVAVQAAQRPGSPVTIEPDAIAACSDAVEASADSDADELDALSKALRASNHTIFG